MKYCEHCGQAIEDNAVVCMHCGRSLQGASGIDDSGNAGYGVLGFFFPVVGLIMYLLWKTEKPRNAKKAGKGALIGVIVQFVLGVFYGILAALLTMNSIVGY